MSEYISEAFRKLVKIRAKSRCEYCQWWSAYSITTFQIDHILPLSKGGLSTLINLAFACGTCNNSKGDRVSSFDVIDNVETSFFNPRTQNWSEHFKWSNDFREIVGKTPTGRITVINLKMNREELKTLRRIFHERGDHPPLIKE